MTDFKTLLEQQHRWPCHFTFKFVVDQTRLVEVNALFPGETPTLKPSAKGNYVSVTFVVRQDTPQSVVDIYAKAGQIKGLIAL